MKLNTNSLSALITAGILTLSTQSFAEGQNNSAVRWVIDDNGIPMSNKSDSFDDWFALPLPYAQKATLVSGDYYHFTHNPGGAGGSGYYEYSAFAAGENGNTYKISDQGWVATPGCWQTKDLSGYGLAHSYCVNGDGTLKRFNQESQSFEGYIEIVSQVIAKIDVDANGLIWAVTETGDIFKGNENGWQQVTVNRTSEDCGKQCKPVNIAVGNGQVLVVSQFDYGHGYGGTALFALEGENLISSGPYIDVDFDRDGVFWGITTWDNSLLYKRPGMTDAQRHPKFPVGKSPIAIGG